MSSSGNWKVPAALQPSPPDYDYDLDHALGAVVGLRAIVPADAFTANTLGTERAGHGVLIRGDGLVLTIGYLITEAESVWITLSDGRAVPGHVLAYDQESGFGLVQALARLDVSALALGRSASVDVGDKVVLAGAGGRQRAVAAQVVAKQQFAGNWEYVVDEAIFTAPPHPNWGGAALIGAGGDLVGIGSLQLQQEGEDGRSEHMNMVVPIDLLKPIFDDLMTLGRPGRPPRPWLGLFAAEVGDKIVAVGLAEGGPAQRARLHTGDVMLAVDGAEVADLAGFFRQIWALGEAGVEVPLRVYRDGRTLDLRIPSSDRGRFFKVPSLH